MANKLIQVQTRPGAEIHSGSLRLTPYAQSVTFHPPGAQGGLIWNRPVSVLARLPDGSEVSLPVRDVTRLWQIGLLALGLLGALLLQIIAQKS